MATRIFLSFIVATACAGIAHCAIGQSTKGLPPVLPPPGSHVEWTFPAEEIKESLHTSAGQNDREIALTSHVEPPVYAWHEPAYWFGPDPWDIGFELGLNGNEGLNEAFSLRAGTHIKRKTEYWKFDTGLVYNKNTSNNIETQNNAQLDVRIDRQLGESPWSIYVLNQDLYDEFQDFDLRVAVNSGVGYQILDLETIELLSRFGGGASREFGGTDDRWAYEALFGFEYKQELSKTQRLAGKIDYFPEWENFSLYRIVTDVGWEVDLDRPQNVSLKFSVVDRYDSTPGGVEPNEVNYSALLIWGL